MPNDLENQTSVLTGAKQTMLSWSRVIESYEAVPEVYKDFFKTQIGNYLEFPFVVLAPALDRFPHWTTEKLICNSNETITILERRGKQIVTIGFPLKTIREVETGNILLRSWVTIRGVTSEGVSASSTVEFNAATGERYFSSFLKNIRPAPGSADETELKAEQAKFDSLALANFKLMNLGRASLVRGENVIQIVLQAEIRKRAWALFGWAFYQTVTPAYLTILTDKELILIQDAERSAGKRAARYGSVQRYIPLKSILSVALAEQENDLLALSIQLSSDECLTKVFEVSAKREIEHLRDEIGKLI